MAAIELTSSEPTESKTRLDVQNSDTVTTPKKRWHFAARTISCARAWIQSYLRCHVIDLDSSQYYPFSIEKTRLCELVRKKDIETLRNLGGIASALQSDIHNGILGDADDLVCRQEAFGSKSYENPNSKSFIHFLPEEI